MKKRRRKLLTVILALIMLLNSTGIGVQKVFAQDVSSQEVGIHDIFFERDDSKLERFKARVLNRLLYLDEEIDVSDIDIDPNEIKYTVGTMELTGIYAAREIVRQNAFHSTTSTTGFPEFTYKDNGCVASVKYTYHPAWKTDLIKSAIAGYDEAMERLNPDDSDFAKILKLHDWIVKNVSYGMSKLYYDFAVGALANRSAVCSGYAQCYGFLLSQAGVESIYIAANTVTEPHAWNLVRFDGHWFHVDCTWDRGLGVNPNVKHTYFMMNDEEFNADGAHSEDWKDPAKGYPTNNVCSIENKFYMDNTDMATDEQIAENPVKLQHEYDAGATYSQSETEHWRTCVAGVEVHEPHKGDPCTECGYQSSKVTEITITFDSQNGDPVFTQTIPTGEKAETPQEPGRAGYTFKGWYTAPEGGDRVELDTQTFERDTVLYAQWEANYNVLYNWGLDAPTDQILPQDDREYATEAEARAAKDHTYTDTTVVRGTKDGKDGTWTFSGWDEGVLNDHTVIFEGRWTFTADETPEIPETTYTLKFETNGGSSIESVAGGAGTAVDLSGYVPVRSGYTFEGWYSDIDLNNSVTNITLNTDMTVYARWTKQQIGDAEDIYKMVSGANSTWTKTDGDSYELVVKRGVDDDTCFSHFTSVQIDGVTLRRGIDYDARSGSTIITLKAAVLQNLSTGQHTVTVNFDDGKVETTLTVDGKSEPGTDEKPEPGTDEKPKPGTDEKPEPGADEKSEPGVDKKPEQSVTKETTWTVNKETTRTVHTVNRSENPGTGDANNATLCLFIMFLSLVSVTASVRRRQNKGKK